MRGWLFALLLCVPAPALAGEADVLEVEVLASGGNTWSFTVTVQHEDQGWDHYADAFEIVSPDGEVLAVRTLFHPHVNEQPFTRSIDNVTVPYEIDEVIVRAHDSVHEYGGAEIIVKIPR
ncbi:MAG: hypothetical protein WDZ84_15165 [Rhodovibrionaceae bacterium]